MLILFGSDHAGFELKERLISYVSELGYEVGDRGAFSYIEEDDYPDFIAPVAKEVSDSPDSKRGIVLGGSGQGEAIVANRFPNVRAVVYNGPQVLKERGEEGLSDSDDVIRLSREHNDSNILSLGAKFLTEDGAKEAVERWLTIPFSGEERHMRRITEIEYVLSDS